MHQISIPSFAVERGHLMRPAKTLDPRKLAIIAIDFPRFFIDDDQPMANAYARDMLDQANRVHAAVRDAGGLVVFTQHSMAPVPPDDAVATPPPTTAISANELVPGSRTFEIHSALTQKDSDVTVIKHQSSPLHPASGTQLLGTLRQRDSETVLITAPVSNGCCDCTARDAFQHGFDVVCASEATAAMTDAEHNAALLNLEIYSARVLSTAAIETAVAQEVI